MAPQRNFSKEQERLIAGLPAEGPPPTLLLHACCAPCSSAVLERLSPHFAITLLYYNPNIAPPAEYHRRADELDRFVQDAGYAGRGITVVRLPYDPQEFYTAVRGLENEPEKGERCTVCYRLRLEQAAQRAKEGGFDWFTTTLTISPLKNAAALNEIGTALGEAYGVRFLPSDFKKREGYKRSITLSHEYGLYRQDFCGCAFSRAAREKEKQNETAVR